MPPLSLAEMNARLRDRLVARAPLLGTFVKTPHPVAVEILARSGFDLAVIDAEHGAVGREAIDLMILAGQAAGLPLIVRVPDDRPATLLGVLDSGAAGVMVPHVTSPAQAAAIAAACRYGPGGRGFAGTTRIAGWGTRPAGEHLAGPAREVSVICQIEDAAGAEAAEAIAAVPGVDALFVGRADLAVSCGFDGFFAPETAALCRQVLATPGAATGLYLAPQEDPHAWRAAGASLIVTGSDHTLMMTGGMALRRAFDAPEAP
jgi:2-keto-3-deoxy-L-rhamnonate aldolase RhmA